MAGKLLNLRMEDDLRQAIEHQQAEDGVATTSVWAREALAGVVELGGLQVLGEILRRRRKGEEPKISPHSARALAIQGTTADAEAAPKCQHPKTAWKHLAYATICTMPGCGVKVR